MQLSRVRTAKRRARSILKLSRDILNFRTFGSDIPLEKMTGSSRGST
jgi:hypothetical protein